MARMVLGLATSHSPQLSLPAEHWLMRGEEDRLNQSLYRVPDGKHVTFDELLAEVNPKIAQERIKRALPGSARPWSASHQTC